MRKYILTANKLKEEERGAELPKIISRSSYDTLRDLTILNKIEYNNKGEFTSDSKKMEKSNSIRKENLKTLSITNPKKKYKINTNLKFTDIQANCRNRNFHNRLVTLNSFTTNRNLMTSSIETTTSQKKKKKKKIFSQENLPTLSNLSNNSTITGSETAKKKYKVYKPKSNRNKYLYKTLGSQGMNNLMDTKCDFLIEGMKDQYQVMSNCVNESIVADKKTCENFKEMLGKKPLADPELHKKDIEVLDKKPTGDFPKDVLTELLEKKETLMSKASCISKLDNLFAYRAKKVVKDIFDVDEKKYEGYQPGPVRKERKKHIKKLNRYLERTLDANFKCRANLDKCLSLKTKL